MGPRRCNISRYSEVVSAGPRCLRCQFHAQARPCFWAFCSPWSDSSVVRGAFLDLFSGMCMTSSSSNLSRTEMRPAKVQVLELVSSRYTGQDGSPSARPADWDSRKEGIDEVRISSGEVLRLYSSAMQSPPQPGWILMLTGGNDSEGYHWTLYGIPRKH